MATVSEHTHKQKYEENWCESIGESNRKQGSNNRGVDSARKYRDLNMGDTDAQIACMQAEDGKNTSKTQPLQRERDRHTHRDRETVGDRERETQRQTHTKRGREGERETEKETERQRQRGRHTLRESERQRETEIDTHREDTERQTEREHVHTHRTDSSSQAVRSRVLYAAASADLPARKYAPTSLLNPAETLGSSSDLRPCSTQQHDHTHPLYFRELQTNTKACHHLTQRDAP